MRVELDGKLYAYERDKNGVGYWYSVKKNIVVPKDIANECRKVAIENGVSPRFFEDKRWSPDDEEVEAEKNISKERKAKSKAFVKLDEIISMDDK